LPDKSNDGDLAGAPEQGIDSIAGIEQNTEGLWQPPLAKQSACEEN